LTTIEGVGGRAKGFNPIQKRLAEYNGSQCGYCSTGMVMNMCNVLLNNPTPSQKLIEDSFDGNICRCTGNLNARCSLFQKINKIINKSQQSQATGQYWTR
jgi:aerobic-type carbon monoxide dehydrogenase small subunit (CoxS/CutS family)